jgi:hypothetical protein
MASPQRLLSEERPPAVRVTSTGGEVFTLQEPHILNDSIARSTAFGPVGMAARDLRLLEVRSFSVAKSVGFITLNALTIAGFMALFIKAQPHYYGF